MNHSDSICDASGFFLYCLREDGTAAIVRCFDNSAALCIPEQLDGHNVTALLESAIEDDAHRAISLPKTVQYIEDAVFLSEQIDRITVDKENPRYLVQDGILLDREDCAVVYCPPAATLSTVLLPPWIRSVRDYAFSCCSHLQKVIFPPTLERIGYEAFEHCTALTEVCLPLTAFIGDWAFDDCPKLNITYISFQNSHSEEPRMCSTEMNPTGDCFIRSRSIWFPDFADELREQEQHYRRLNGDFSVFLILLCYLRGEMPRGQFVTQFSETEAPQNMLRRQRALYTRLQTLCAAYQNHGIGDAAFDEQLLLAFRGRPTEDVFSPTDSKQNEIIRLMARLDEKAKQLPPPFDGTAWNSFFSGRLTRRQYADACLSFGVADRLTQAACEDAFAQAYRTEISVCQQLQALCTAYRDGQVTPDSFDIRFTALANAFCADAPESSG